MSELLGRWHQQHFDKRFSLDEDGRRAKADILRAAGLPEDEVKAMTRPGILPGMSFGGAATADVGRVVEQLLFRQGAEAVLLRVVRPPHDEAGHVQISVLEVVEPPVPGTGQEVVLD